MQISVVIAMDAKFRLTKQQFELLKFIYSNRFVTSLQVQRFLGKAHVQQAQQRLNTLLAKQYIGRRYSSDDKLLGRYAGYFLLPNGMDIIKGYADTKALRLMRKDVTASQRFIDHNIAIGDVAAELKRIYTNVLEEIDFQTKTDIMFLSRLEYERNWDGNDDYELMIDAYPEPVPDGYLEGLPLEENAPEDYFVEIWHSSVPFWVYRKRIQYLIEYTDEGIWKDHFGWETPSCLLVCDTPTLQRRVQRYLRRMYDSVSHDYQFLVTNLELLSQAKDNEAIWTRVDDEVTETIRLTDVPERNA